MSPLPGKSLLPKFPASAGAMARRPEVLPAPSARGQKCSTATKGPTWAETPAACRPVQRDAVRDPRVGCLSSLQPNGWASPTLQEFSCQVQVQWNFSTRDPSTWDLSSQGAPHPPSFPHPVKATLVHHLQGLGACLRGVGWLLNEEASLGKSVGFSCFWQATT